MLLKLSISIFSGENPCIKIYCCMKFQIIQLTEAWLSTISFSLQFISSNPFLVLVSNIFMNNGTNKPLKISFWINLVEPLSFFTSRKTCSPSKRPGNPIWPIQRNSFSFSKILHLITETGGQVYWHFSKQCIYSKQWVLKSEKKEKRKNCG